MYKQQQPTTTKPHQCSFTSTHNTSKILCPCVQNSRKGKVGKKWIGEVANERSDKCGNSLDESSHMHNKVGIVNDSNELVQTAKDDSTSKTRETTYCQGTASAGRVPILRSNTNNLFV